MEGGGKGGMQRQQVMDVGVCQLGREGNSGSGPASSFQTEKEPQGMLLGSGRVN